MGVDADHPTNALDETSILNPGTVGRVLALLVIASAFEQAAALDPSDGSIGQRASLYRGLAERGLLQTAVVLDLDGDGIADSTRRLDVLAMARL